MGLYKSIKDQLHNLTMYDENGNPGMPMDLAIETVKAEMDKTDPNPEHPEIMMRELWNQLTLNNPHLKNIQPKVLANPDEMRKRIEYCGKCRDAMLKAIARQTQRIVEFERLATEMYGPNSGVNQKRWIENLIQLPEEEPDETKRRLHNEEVVAVTALVERLPQPDPKAAFRQRRLNTYLNDYHLSPEEAESRAQHDLEYGAARLLDFALEEVNKYYGREAEMIALSNSIIDGSAADKEGALEEAYNHFCSPGNQLMFDALDIKSNLVLFGLESREEELDIMQKNWEKSSFSVPMAMANMVANPFYSLLDPAELEMLNATGGMPPKRVTVTDENGKPFLKWKEEIITDANGNPLTDDKGNVILDKNGELPKRRTAVPVEIDDNDLDEIVLENGNPVKDISGRTIKILPKTISPYKYDFTEDVYMIKQAKADYIKSDILPQYGLKKCKSEPAPHPMEAYTNGRGRTVILYTESVCTYGGFKVNIIDNVPGRLVSIGLNDDVKKLTEMSTEHDRLGHSSANYRAMKKALKKLKGIRVDDNPNEKQLRELEKKFRAVQAAAQTYLGGKDRDALRSDYERFRYNFAKDLNEFATGNIARIGLIREHRETLRQKAFYEAEEEVLKSKNPAAVPNDGLTAFERAVKEDDDRIAAEEQRMKEEQQRAERERAARQKAEEKAALVAAGNKVCDAINALTADREKLAPAISDAEADKQLADFVEKNKAECLNATDEKTRRAAGEKTIAGMALGELIKREQEMGLNKPFRTVVNAGRMKDAIEMIMATDEFDKNIKVFDVGMPGGLENQIARSAPGRISITMLRGAVAALAEKQNEQKEKNKKAPANENKKDAPKIENNMNLAK